MEKIGYWDCDDNTERLYHEDMDEAIESFLDETELKDTPDILDVHFYEQKQVNVEKFKAHVLEASYDFLGEEYDGEDGHDQCEKIKEAAQLFVDTYLKNYDSWMCQITKTEKVNVAEWIKKNKPDWN